MTEAIIQMHVDYWHFKCQLYQFMVYIDKFGKEKAIKLMEPDYVYRDGVKVYSGHLNKFEQMNLHYIENYNNIKKEMQKMKDESVPKAELKHAIKMLKGWKSKFVKK